jgi:hypothetical protein
MSKHDPLEDAKVSDKKKIVVKPKPMEADATEVSEPVTTMVADQSPKASPSAKTYRVVKDQLCSWRGHLTTMKAGSIVNERFYGGPDGVQLLRNAGVELELISE